MKVKKRTAMIISFALGSLLLGTTILADITTKSGYDQFKNALKVTAEQCSEKFDSYTMDYSMAMKDNGKTLVTENDVHKYDGSKNASEKISSRLRINGDKVSTQTYSDKTTEIRVSANDPTYYVTEFTKERKEEAFPNPFKEEGADDLEKIVDAIVGNLKDHVVVTENADGSKGLTGSLTEVQIPSLVSAVASFQMKQEFNGQQDNLPHLTKDVFVKEVKGSAKVNKDGVMESILGTAVLSGKDDQGTVHEISIEVLIKILDINSTKVTKPDLAGKKVVKDIAKYYSDSSEITNPEKFIGKYKNDIVIEKDGKFVKIGERFVDITQINNQVVAGRYYEKMKPEFEDYASYKSEIQFAAEFEKGAGRNALFDATTESGDKVHGSIYMDEDQGKVNFNLHVGTSDSYTGNLVIDSNFSPVLD